jgi:hypothetical protein
MRISRWRKTTANFEEGMGAKGRIDRSSSPLSRIKKAGRIICQKMKTVTYLRGLIKDRLPAVKTGLHASVHVCAPRCISTYLRMSLGSSILGYYLGLPLRCSACPKVHIMLTTIRFSVRPAILRKYSHGRRRRSYIDKNHFF